MIEHDVVEVDPAETLVSGRLGGELETVARAPHQRHVERAAAEVVHGHQRAGNDRLLLGVPHRRGFRFGDQVDRELHDSPDRLQEQVPLVRTPRGGVAHRDPARRTSPSLALDRVEGEPQQLSLEVFGKQRELAHHHRVGTAEPPLELGRDAFGGGEQPTSRRRTELERTGVVDRHR